MKKTITFLSVMFALCTGAFAQYYYVPHANAGTNPGGINTDTEYPYGGGPVGWTSISTPPYATPAWTTTQTIPFAFSFNGSAVTQYKVSSSAILTFDVATALAAPAYAKAALPSALIPDNSVCIWGLAALGANDNILTKTFGTAPNRQHWIQFNSYGYGAVASGNYDFTYWSIVLEETTNKIYIVDQRTGGYAATKMVSAGIQINSSTAVSVAGSPSLASLANTDATPANNSYYEFIQGTQAAVDAHFSELSPATGTPASFGITGANVSISAKLTNYGSSNITGVTFKYSDGTNTFTDNITGLNLGSFDDVVLTHSTTFPIPGLGLHPLSVWFELAGDADLTNDSGSTVIQGVSFIPVHAVVFEEATGTWCGWCPRGTVFMDSMASVHPDAILIAVHNGDPMVDTDYDNGVGSIVSGYPSVLVNRNIVADPNTMFTQYNDHINDFGVADITTTANYNFTTGTATIDLSAHFAADLSGDYRLAAVFTEDDLTGTTTDWDQANYYSFQTNNTPLVGAGHDWQAEPDPVPASQMEYDHVAKTILGGFDGQPSSLPATIVAGSTHTYSFNYNVPVGSDINKMHVYGLLIDAVNGIILNGSTGTITLGLNEEQAVDYSVNLFPNPATDMTRLSFNVLKESTLSIELIDVLGNAVSAFSTKLQAGKQEINMNLKGLASGVYSVRIGNEQGFVTRKLMITGK